MSACVRRSRGQGTCVTADSTATQNPAGSWARACVGLGGGPELRPRTSLTFLLVFRRQTGGGS